MARQGISLYSHTHAFLSDLSEEEVYVELKTSKETIENIIHLEVSGLVDLEINTLPRI